MRSVAQTESAIQVLMSDGAAAGEGAAPGHGRNLQLAILKTNAVIAVDGALELQREDAVQIASGTGNKGAATLRRRDLKAMIEFGDVAFAQKAIGLF